VKARIPNFLSLIALSCFAIASLAPAARGEDPKAQWVWLGGGEESQKVAFRKSFEVGGDVKQARIAATCDNVFQLFLNGQPVLSGDSWNRLESVDVTAKLKPGKNTLAALGTDEGGLAGFILRMDVVDKAGKVMTLVTDASWKGASAATPLAANWNSAGFDDASWKAVAIKGAVGAGNLPWSDSVDAAALAVAAGQPPKPVDARPVPAENVTAKNGFRVEKLFDVPSQMGSWVSLSTDGKGRLIASDQGNAGLYMIEPAAIGKPDAITKVTKLPVDISSAQGLLWAHDSLYVVVNGGKSGLHRAKDTDGDGLVDSSEYLMKIDGGGEHGPHAVILAQDGQSLLVDAGNHTKLPEISGSRIPTNWGEDHVLPRRWDANGHAAGILAPGGWICKVDPDGKKWEVVSMGYRNQYDIALNADGELFSYDADMEWDFGSPWYRPTRVVHATSGSEFGWRSGTGKWPTYYEDSLPPAVDIGPGSPVGVTFGYGTKYPAKYQKALYVLDWTYSTIYACHLTPDGSSYKGEIEDFVYGQPMQVTDATVGPDGALYFTVGGRGTKSALMRVVYEGDESTAPVNAKDEKNRELREVRRQLEAFHRQGDADMNLIWSQLGHADRFIRYAARIALENRPVDAWKAKALAETNPRSALTALMALARQGAPEDRGAVLAALGRINPKQLELQEQLTWLRNHQLALVRLGEVTEQERAELIKRLEPLFPSDNNAFNTELMQLLVRLESPEAVKRGVAMMQKLAAEAEPIPPWGEIANRNAGYGGTARAMMDNMPPVRSIAYAFALRNAKTGWTEELRKAYLAFFSKAAMHPGGASYPGFLKQSRDDALANVPTNELPLYDEILSVPLGGKPFEATPPKGPGKTWTKDEALASLGSEIKGANFDAGRNLFHATQCAKCHRFSGEGGAIGPDLSTAGRKFALPDMMDAILEPSKAISDQYGSHQVVTSDGKTLIGRVVELGEQLQVYTADVNVPPQTIKKDDVEEMVVSKVSQMPAGTVDTLNPEELKHLIAFIMSGGDRNAPYFKP
jgi:putative heme-binding domain-containing protein